MGLNSTPLRIPRSQPHFLSNTIKGSKEGAKARHVIVKNEESSKSETELERLGILTQGSATSPIELEFFPSRAGVIVLKQVKDSIKDVEIQRLKKLDHQNIVKFIDLVSLHDLRYLRLELKTYLTTLDEYIQSTQPISENELGVLISHMFNAISYIGNQGIIHSKINTHSFRICSQTGNVILTNFECIEEFPEGKLPNTDLENLGLTIIHCVEGDTLKSLDDVRERRMSNAFFIDNIEPWVGSEQFTDFLDYLFSRSRAASNKLKSPHSYIRKRTEIDSKILLGSVFCAPFRLARFWQDR